jgi:hypothetical protein
MSNAATAPDTTVPPAPPAPSRPPYRSIVVDRDALGFALSDALASLDDCEMYLTDDAADGLIDNVDEAQTFVRDALFEALHVFGVDEGDDLVWRSQDGEAVVFQAPQRDVAEVIAVREANTVEV